MHRRHPRERSVAGRQKPATAAPSPGSATGMIRGGLAEGGRAVPAGILRHVHQFRAFAIVLIVTFHCSIYFHWGFAPLGTRLADSLLRNGTVLFVFIAGFLFQHLSAKFTFGRYLWRKWRNVLVPYLIWSAPAIIYEALARTSHSYLPHDFHGQGLAYRIGWYVLMGKPMVPYWFIPMVALLYLLAPLLVRLDRHPRAYWSLIPLFGVAVLLHRPEHNLNAAHSLAYYLPVYILGMFVSRYESQISDVVLRWRRVLILALALLVGCEVMFYETLGKAHAPLLTGSLFIDTNLAQKALASVILLATLRQLPSLFGRWGNVLADLSFGIYFVHWYVLRLFEELLDWRGSPWEWNALLHGLLAAAAISACVLVLLAGKRLLGEKSRMILGC